jgi:DUF2911 family protein
MKKIIFLAVIVTAVIAVVVAQKAEDKSKRPSPPASASFTFANGAKVTIDYSRPSMRGRKIFGGLVPYDQAWRTGANDATTFVITSDVIVNGVKVPKGEYTLWTLPGENGWKLIINKETGQWGTKYDGSQDLVRIDAKASTLAAPVEKFLISFDKASDPNTAELHLDWEKTRVSATLQSVASAK